jgi:hypothetical protein
MSRISMIGRQINLRFDVATRNNLNQASVKGSRILHFTSDVSNLDYLVLESEYGGLVDEVNVHELHKILGENL